jgi:hypothetical protein
VLHEGVPLSTGSFLCLHVSLFQLTDVQLGKHRPETHVFEDVDAHRELLLDTVLPQQANQRKFLKDLLPIGPEGLLEQGVAL